MNLTIPKTYINISLIIVFLLFTNTLLSQISNQKNYEIENLYFDAILLKNWIKTDSLRKILKKHIVTEEDKANFNYYKGYEFFHKEEYKKALEHYLKARKQFIELRDIENQAELEGAIVEIIAYMDPKLIDYEIYLNSLCEIASKTKSKTSVSDCEYFRGYFKEIEGKYNDALKHYINTGLLALKYKDTLAYYTNEINVGSMQLKLKKYKKALNTFNKSKSYYNKIGNLDKNFLINLYISKILLAQKKHSLSLDALNKSKNINAVSPSYENSFDLYTQFSEFYFQTKNYKKAYTNSIIAQLYKDTIVSKKTEKEIYQFKLKYEVSEKENKLIKIENENLNLKNKRTQNLTALLISILTIIVLSFVILFFKKKYNVSKNEFQTIQQELNTLKEQRLNSNKIKEGELINLKSKAILNSSEILYIKSDGHYVEYHLDNKNKPEIDRNSLNEVLKILPNNSFVRIHRSFVVNIYRIKIINSSKVMLDNGVWINLSRTYKQQLKDILHKED
ncbi:MAG: LytR/AlgR family response regulator transcription factor [Lacinutrix venerupis]